MYSLIDQKLSLGLRNKLTKLDPNAAKIVVSHLLKNPRYISSGFKLMNSLKKSKKLRVNNLKNGLMVPPALILSITSRCNLGCTGCFAAATGVLNHQSTNELTIDQWRSIIREAKSLGVFCFVIAGGEPFLYKNLLELCKEFKTSLFMILTNGTSINYKIISDLNVLNNTIILVSIEGGKELTNSRRGEGVYEQAMNMLKKINETGTPCGISITITRNNYLYWMNAKNIDTLIEKGIRIGAFIEYIPTTVANCGMDGTDHHLMLTCEQRVRFREKMLFYRENKNIYIIHSPGDEEFFGGCVSAGRGFAHVTPSGDLTACPISNVATHNLTRSSLKEALSSRLFCEIRNNEHLLETHGMPCALFAHPEEMDLLAKKVDAYRTD